MKPLYLYAFEVCLCSGELLGLYRWLFEQRVPFRACRIYLLAALVVSAVIPALRIPVYPAAPVAVPAVVGQVEPQWSRSPEPAVVLSAAEPLRTVDWPRVLSDTLLGIYLAAVCGLFVLLAVRLAAIGRLRRQARLTLCRDYVLAEHAAVRTPFSFLRTVYLGEGFDGPRRSIVLRHEASHVRHRHSVERVVMEAMLCLLWFNPFAWLTARRLREVQEWEADRDVLAAGCDLTEYRMTLFSQLFGCNPDMTCGLSHSFTKQRFLMMTRNKWGRFAGWRLAAALPFVGGLLCLYGFTTREVAAAEDKTAIVRIAADGSVMFDGKAVTLEQLESDLASFRAGLSAGELADAYVELAGASSAPMAAVTEVKELLRRVPLLRVRYRCGENSVSRMLPPVPGTDGRVQIVGVVPDKPNGLSVSINEKGEVIVEYSGVSEAVSLAALPGRIAGFVEGKIGHAERITRSLGLPDGRSVDYPVSRGVVCLVHTRPTPYGAYVSVQQAVTAGFERVRDALAREWFGRGLAALTDAERQAVRQAVPVAVFDRD